MLLWWSSEILLSILSKLNTCNFSLNLIESSISISLVFISGYIVINYKDIIAIVSIYNNLACGATNRRKSTSFSKFPRLTVLVRIVLITYIAMRYDVSINFNSLWAHVYSLGVKCQLEQWLVSCYSKPINGRKYEKQGCKRCLYHSIWRWEAYFTMLLQKSPTQGFPYYKALRFQRISFNYNVYENASDLAYILVISRYSINMPRIVSIAST